MFVLYDAKTKYVLDIVDALSIKNDCFIIEKGNIKVCYLNNNNNIIALPIAHEDITFKDGIPLIYDEEQGLVYPDPFYVEEEEIPDNGSSGDSDEDKPMTVAEMRTKIKELEEQLVATKILLGVE